MKTIRPARGGAAALLLLLLLAAGCGDGSSGDPVGTDTRPIPDDEAFYISAVATVLPPVPNPPPGQNATTLPRTCDDEDEDGVPIPAGTVLEVDPDIFGGGIVFSAPRPNVPSDVPLGNPTNIQQIIVSGTDLATDNSLSLQLPSIANLASTFGNDPANPNLPLVVDHMRFSGVFNTDPFCDVSAGVLFVTEQADCVDPNMTPCGGQGQPPCCSFALGDQLVIDEVHLMEDANGEIVFVPGSPIGGTASFLVQTNFRDPNTGGTIFAQMMVDVCFRLPALTPPGDLDPSPAPCP